MLSVIRTSFRGQSGGTKSSDFCDRSGNLSRNLISSFCLYIHSPVCFQNCIPSQSRKKLNFLADIWKNTSEFDKCRGNVRRRERLLKRRHIPLCKHGHLNGNLMIVWNALLNNLLLIWMYFGLWIECHLARMWAGTRGN